MCMLCARRGQTEVSGLLELELRMVVSLRVTAGNASQVLLTTEPFLHTLPSLTLSCQAHNGERRPSFCTPSEGCIVRAVTVPEPRLGEGPHRLLLLRPCRTVAITLLMFKSCSAGDWKTATSPGHLPSLQLDFLIHFLKRISYMKAVFISFHHSFSPLQLPPRLPRPLPNLWPLL